jgi:hypothetical protein
VSVEPLRVQHRGPQRCSRLYDQREACVNSGQMSNSLPESRRDEDSVSRAAEETEVRWQEILSGRLFVTRMRRQAPMDRYYSGREPTRQTPNVCAHAVMFAI